MIFNRKKKNLEKLRLQWGKPKIDALNFDRVQYYSDLFDKPSKLSEQVMKDLNLFEVFHFIDRTNCRVGQQYLFNQLQNPLSEEELASFNLKVEFFNKNVLEREETQRLLLPLDNNDAYFIPLFFRSNVYKRPTWINYLYLSVISLIILLLSSIIYPPLLLVALFPAGLNILIHFWNKNNIVNFIKSLPELNKLVTRASLLIKRNPPSAQGRVKVSLKALKSFQMRFSLLYSDTTGADDWILIFLFLLELLQAVFLVQVFAFHGLMKVIRTKQPHFIKLFEFVGEIDAALSVASLRASGQPFCLPHFTGKSKRLRLEGIYHPLIDECITNDFFLDGKGALITGSNMSGKTTFIRTIAVNTILAQSIYTCFAKKFEAPFLSVQSSIRVNDDLMQGKSLFMEEVAIFEGLIQMSQEESQVIYFLDEVFKGTNTIERIAASKAILSFLNKKENIVIVTSHDLELVHFLEEEFDLYHFTESIKDNSLCFDYKLREGELKSTNAIEILRRSMYPQEIIEESRRVEGILRSLRNF